jgi:hypothetical protein
MKNKRSISLAFVGGVLGVFLQFNAQAATIAVTPGTQSVSAGSSFDLSVVISGLGNGAAPALGAFDFDVLFDSSLISLTGVSFGDPLLGDQLDIAALGSYTASASAAPGQVNLVELSFDTVATLNNSQADSFVLAVLSFDALNVGSSGVNLNNVLLGDASGNALLATVINASVQVVPVPASLLLLGSALGWLSMLRRRLAHHSAKNAAIG